MMLAEIITIGDEILIGQVIDANSAWIARELNLIGIKVKQISSISDDKKHIINALDSASKRAALIIITGGLGPTKDDITKLTLCEYFDTRLVFNQGAFEDIKRNFNAFGNKIIELNRHQAELPQNCIPFKNIHGTAPGMWFEKNGKVFISMPGVPYEMKAMMKNEILSKLKEHFHAPKIIHRTIVTHGIAESVLSEKIGRWENDLECDNISLAYLPSPGMVRLRLSITGNDEKQIISTINKKIEELNKIIPSHISAYNDEKIEATIGKLLVEKRRTLATAESCTGGYIAHKITSVPGSSRYYKGSVISYSDEIKKGSLNVSGNSLEKHGAVSEQVAIEMAKGVQKSMKTDYAIACTGIAGPDGGGTEKPVGTVWIAIAAPEKTFAKKFLFGNNRDMNIHLTASAALNMLRKELLR